MMLVIPSKWNRKPSTVVAAIWLSKGGRLTDICGPFHAPGVRFQFQKTGIGYPGWYRILLKSAVALFSQ